MLTQAGVVNIDQLDKRSRLINDIVWYMKTNLLGTSPETQVPRHRVTKFNFATFAPQEIKKKDH